MRLRRQQSDPVSRIQKGLSELARRADAGITAIDLQPLLVTVAEPSYPEFRAGWTKAWRKGEYSTAAWPGAIAPREFAVLVLPLPAGRVVPAVGRHPRPAATPSLAVGDNAEATSRAVLADWIETPAENVTARLAPPVTETRRRGGETTRRLFDLRLAWPLPASDGV